MSVLLAASLHMCILRSRVELLCRGGTDNSHFSFHCCLLRDRRLKKGNERLKSSEHLLSWQSDSDTLTGNSNDSLQCVHECGGQVCRRHRLPTSQLEARRQLYCTGNRANNAFFCLFHVPVGSKKKEMNCRRGLCVFLKAHGHWLLAFEAHQSTLSSFANERRKKKEWEYKIKVPCT